MESAGASLEASVRSGVSARPPISVVVPVYYGERTIAPLCERLIAALSSFTDDLEIILVDDRSPDASWPLMVRLAHDLPQVVAVRLSRNFGQHYAITAGLEIARGDWVVIMDCDLQDRPEDIPSLIEAGQRGADVVLARRHDRQHSASKQFFSRMFYQTFRLLSGSRIDPAVGTFRALRRPVVLAYRRMGESGRLFGGMIEWLGFETTHVDVQHAARTSGPSSYSIRALAKLATDGIFAFSNRPLYFSIAIGLAISAAAGLYGVFLVLRFLIHPTIAVQGWLSTITLNAFIGGLILLNLGIIGIYIGRIYDQVKARPLFVVDQIIGLRPGVPLPPRSGEELR